MKGLTHHHKWIAVRTIFPYPYGWGTYCPRCKTVVDTGLPSKEMAKEICSRLQKTNPIKI